MVETLFKLVNDGSKSTWAKLGSGLMTIAQYLYRRRKSGDGKDAITKSGFGKQLSEALNERFS